MKNICNNIIQLYHVVHNLVVTEDRQANLGRSSVNMPFNKCYYNSSNCCVFN